MEQEGLETIETEQEEQCRREEADVLRSILASRIRALVGEGIFTDKEGRDWLDACADDPPEWVQGLLDCLGEFEDSGMEVMGKIDELLESPVFTGIERAMLRRHAEDASYQEKLRLVGLLEMTKEKRLAEREALQKTKYRSVEELISKIKTAITGDRLEEAGMLLGKLSPSDNPVGYEKLSRDLARARIVQTRNQINTMMAA